MTRRFTHSKLVRRDVFVQLQHNTRVLRALASFCDDLLVVSVTQHGKQQASPSQRGLDHMRHHILRKAKNTPTMTQVSGIASSHKSCSGLRDRTSTSFVTGSV